ncbi:sterile alpha motif domain-containing protein 1-like [Manacus candei]|uniref:sterile alpha motif domain-containing protein 1-like n=1 Tax=Manacus candei TaxID=415023 RepID=UPI002227A1AF|nr:sterile alpha motif domain-containing protein 1-like [Manacus candei]
MPGHIRARPCRLPLSPPLLLAAARRCECLRRGEKPACRFPCLQAPLAAAEELPPPPPRRPPLTPVTISCRARRRICRRGLLPEGGRRRRSPDSISGARRDRPGPERSGAGRAGGDCLGSRACAATPRGGCPQRCLPPPAPGAAERPAPSPQREAARRDGAAGAGRGSGSRIDASLREGGLSPPSLVRSRLKMAAPSLLWSWRTSGPGPPSLCTALEDFRSERLRLSVRPRRTSEGGGRHRWCAFENSSVALTSCPRVYPENVPH